MSTLQRVWLSVTRHAGRSLVISALLLIVLTSLVSHAGVSSALSASSKGLGAAAPALLLASPDATLTTSKIDAAAQAAGTGQCATATQTTARAEGITPVTSQDGPQLAPGAADPDGNPALSLGVLGTTDAVAIPGAAATTQLVEGSQTLSPGTALIHQDLAKANNLALGSTLTLSHEGRSTTVKVVGLLKGTTSKPGALPSERAENQVVTDLATAQDLTGADGLHLAHCPLPTAASAGNSLSQVMEQAVTAAQSAVGSDAKVTDAAGQRSAVLGAVSGIKRLLGIMLAGVVLLGTAVLALTLVLLVRGRVHEVGVFMAVGMPRRAILGQIVLEVLGLAVVCTPLALGLGQLATGALAGAVAQRVGPQAETLLAHPHLSLLPTLGALGLGAVVVMAALAVALAPVLTRPPREVLATAR